MSLNLTAPVHRGMMELDRDAFKLSVPLVGARVPAARTGSFLKAEQLKRCAIVRQFARQMLN